jgi:hypothetical protein
MQMRILQMRIPTQAPASSRDLITRSKHSARQHDTAKLLHNLHGLALPLASKPAARSVRLVAAQAVRVQAAAARVVDAARAGVTA